jgi:hypothetical protein
MWHTNLNLLLDSQCVTPHCLQDCKQSARPVGVPYHLAANNGFTIRFQDPGCTLDLLYVSSVPKLSITLLTVVQSRLRILRIPVCYSSQAVLGKHSLVPPRLSNSGAISATKSNKMLPTIAITRTELPESSEKDARVQQAIAAYKKTQKKLGKLLFRPLIRNSKHADQKFQGGLAIDGRSLTRKPTNRPSFNKLST